MNKKIVFKLLIGFLCFFIVTKVDAATCSTNELNTLKQLATNINFSYDLYSEEETPDHRYYFNIKVTNFTDKFYIKDSNGFEFQYVSGLNQNGERILRQVMENTKMKFTIYTSISTSCPDTQILTKEVETPYFNHYSLREECIGIEGFSLCQRYYGGYIPSDEYFLEQINLYKNGGAGNNEGKGIIGIVTDFIMEHLIIAIPIAIVVLIAVVIVIVKVVINRKKIKIKI